MTFPNRFLVFLTLSFNGFTFSTRAQKLLENAYPIIGQKCPEYTFKEIAYYKMQQASISDFRGKWLILDFWSRGCASCVSSFAKYQQLQNEFKDEIQILLIGYNSSASNQSIRTLYKNLRSRKNVNLPVAWDTALYWQFRGFGVPYLVAVDPTGTVRAIVNELNKDNIKDLLEGRKPTVSNYRMSVDKPDSAYNYYLPLLVNGNSSNGGNDTSYMYRSLFTRWNEKMPNGNAKNEKGWFEITGYSLQDFYKIAFTGTTPWTLKDTSLYANFYDEPVLDITDSSYFKSRDGLENRYCYSLQLPTDTQKQVTGANLDFFRTDLKNILSRLFPFTACIEVKQIPVYKLKLTKNSSSNFYTTGKQSGIYVTVDSCSITNLPIDNAIGRLLYNVPSTESAPVINETGLHINIDIKFSCDMTDIQEIRKSLQKNGLDLIKGFKEMNAVVIHDANSRGSIKP